MEVTKNERVIPVDIDDTLLMHDYEAYPDSEWLEILCPYTGEIITLAINENMVRIVREEYARGSCLIGWSSGGFRWAEAVIKALGLFQCFSYVFTKPTAYLDDQHANEWAGRKVHIDPKKAYKRVAPRINID